MCAGNESGHQGPDIRKLLIGGAAIAAAAFGAPHMAGGLMGGMGGMGGMGMGMGRGMGGHGRRHRRRHERRSKRGGYDSE